MTPIDRAAAQRGAERKVIDAAKSVAANARAAARAAEKAASAALEAAKAANEAAAAAREASRVVSGIGRRTEPLARHVPAPRRSQAGTAPVKARTLRVGADARYRVPSEAARIARDGDIIEIAAGNYVGDVAVWRANNLVLRGVGGRAHLESRGRTAEGKAIWVIKGDNNVVENIEFSGARVRHKNGAGIRLEGAGLTIRHSYFHDNQIGILTNHNPNSDVLIESSEFARNHLDDYDGSSPPGHNIYVGRVRKFTLRGSYIHHASIGHNVKSRARETRLMYNRLIDGRDGNSSYIVDLPNGGRAVLIGNVIQQSRHTDNWAIINFASNRKSPSDRLVLVNNTIVNERSNGIFVKNHSSGPALLINNILAGRGTPLSGPGRLVNNLLAASPGPRRSLMGGFGQAPRARKARGKLSGNLEADHPAFRDFQNYDYRLTRESPAIDAGSDPRHAEGNAPVAEYEYVHPLKAKPRKPAEKPDIGAHEFSAG